MRLALHRNSRFLVGGFDQAEDFARRLVKPVAEILDVVLLLRRQVGLVSLGDRVSGQPFDSMVNISALAERFTAFVGQPPMQYLANWRMQLAANHLQSGTDSVAQIAESVGYESEAAFSRAFKKVVGTPPSHWRKQRGGNGGHRG